MDFEINPKSDISNYGSYDPDVTSLPAPGNFTPQQIATAYNIPSSNGAGAKIGILSLGGGFLPSDLTKSMIDLGLPGVTINCIPVNQPMGWTNTTNFEEKFYANGKPTPNTSGSVENTLDIFCVAGMVPNANITIYIGNVTSQQTWISLYNRAIEDGCDIITQSWSVADRGGDFLSAPLANAAIQGISVFNSTGDYGSANKVGTEGPNYPATNANVIAVGGTILTVNNSNQRLSETAATRSGGGISTDISLPNYQNGKTYQTYNSNTHTTGNVMPLLQRGIPDISAPYQNYAFYFNGKVLPGVNGTSAATPIIAGMMARFISLNNGRRPPANSISTILYSNSNCFYDITVGNNAYSLPDGYLATPGWDPVTGLGAPNGQALYQAISTAGISINNGGNTLSQVKSIYINTTDGTWTPVQVKHIWNMTSSGWAQSY
jgi:kumamolisin